MTNDQTFTLHPGLIQPTVLGGRKTITTPILKQPPEDDMHQSVDAPGEFNEWTWWSGAYTITIYHSAKPPCGTIGSTFKFENIDSEMKIKSVSVKRVFDLTEEDALNEGARACNFDHTGWPCVENNCCGSTALDSLKSIWNQLHTREDHTWDKNPWVWVIEFENLEISE